MSLLTPTPAGMKRITLVPADHTECLSCGHNKAIHKAEPAFAGQTPVRVCFKPYCTCRYYRPAAGRAQ